MVAINVTHTLDKAAATVKGWQGAIPEATAKAMNDTAFDVRKAEQAEMASVFDRVTPYMTRSVFVTMATPQKLQAVIEPRYQGGKGVDPQKTLAAEVFGGPRKNKGGEAALQRAGILPSGYQMVPGQACPLDAYGNVRGSFIVQIITYFRASSEQGFKANMTDKRRKGLAKVGRTADGYKTINGVAYFVALGRLRGGKGSHLAPGIYSKTGTHGSNVKPILMFVRRANYKPKLDYAGVGLREVNRKLPKAFDYRYTQALRKVPGTR